MKLFMNQNDLVVAEIKGISYADKLISLHIRNDKFGKLEKGVLIEVNNCLIGKMKTHFVDHLGIRFIFGINGFIWMQPANGEFGSDNLETIAKFRNLLRIFNKAFIFISPDFLFEVFAFLGTFHAKDLIVEQNELKIIDQIKTALKRNKYPN